MNLPYTLVCLDLETTDLDPTIGSVIQIAAIAVDQNFEPIQGREFNLFVKPLDSYRNPKAMSVNKITEDTLLTGFSLNDTLELFESFCETEYVLASWGTYFDIPFLKEQYKKIGRKWPHGHKTFDLKTVAIWEMAKRNISEQGGVQKMLETLHLQFKGIQHDALDDIKNSVEVLKNLK